MLLFRNWIQNNCNSWSPVVEYIFVLAYKPQPVCFYYFCFITFSNLMIKIIWLEEIQISSCKQLHSGPFRSWFKFFPFIRVSQFIWLIAVIASLVTSTLYEWMVTHTPNLCMSLNVIFIIHVDVHPRIDQGWW